MNTDDFFLAEIKPLDQSKVAFLVKNPTTSELKVYEGFYEGSEDLFVLPEGKKIDSSHYKSSNFVYRSEIISWKYIDSFSE
jgi:hypothetical protein